MYHLAKNHPSIDGNKWTAFAMAEAFLIVNGFVLNFSNDGTYDLVAGGGRGD